LARCNAYLDQLRWRTGFAEARSRGTDLLLASLDAQFAAMATELDATLVSGPEQWPRLWQRDRGILKVARSAQAKRLARAAAIFTLAHERDARPD
jgi:hypothetical protein